MAGLGKRWFYWAFVIYAVSTFVSMAAMSIGVAILLVVLVTELGGPREFARAVRGEMFRPRARWLFYAASALAVFCVLSLLAGLIWPATYGGRSASIHFFRDALKVWYLFLPFAVAAGLRSLNQRDRTAVFRAWLVAFVIFSCFGVLQYFWGWPRPRTIPGHEPFHHVQLGLGHHLSYASVFIFPFFFWLECLQSRLAGWRIRRSWLIGGAWIGFMALMGTFSRTLWLALPVGVLVWLIWSLPKRFRAPLTIGSVLLAVGIYSLPVVQNRLHTSLGVLPRERLWQANWQMFIDRPVLGVGFRKNEQLSGYYLIDQQKSADVFAGHAHNNFLDILSGVGALGAAAWLFWCGVVFWLIWQARQSGSIFSQPYLFRRPLLCAWLVFQVNGLTQVNFWEGKVMHQMMWSVAWLLLATAASVPPPSEKRHGKT
ncbi:MAG: O-antigen ligase family protein [Bacteriovoracia bacterium]